MIAVTAPLQTLPTGFLRPNNTSRTAAKAPLFCGYIDKFNPSNGALLGQYQITGDDKVAEAVENARSAFHVWRQSSLPQRRALLNDLSEAICKEVDTIATLISQETGKPFKESIEADVTSAVSILTHYAKIGPKLLKDKRLPFDKSLIVGRVHYERHVPKGVVGIISPWNFPFAIPMGGIAAALMAGNAVVLKPSEMTPGVAQKMADIIQQVLRKHHLPAHLVQVLIGDGATGQALMASNIDYAVFTGGEKTGRAIAKSLQERGLEASLELGGSDPMIVLEENKNLDAVTSYALWGRFFNTGQTCGAVKRLFVHRSQYADVVQRLKTKIETLSQGGPDTMRHHIGPMISQRHLNDLASQVADAVSKGARVITGGSVKEGPGWFYKPTLLTDVPPDARVLNEEVFGPVLPVIPYDTTEQAVKMANQSRYGLTGSVFGEPRLAQEVAEQLEVGVAAINDVGTTQFAFPSIPWSGWKNSGPGASHGARGLLDMTRTQTISRNYLYHLPLFRKQSWHFAPTPAPGDQTFSKTLLKAFGQNKFWAKLLPGFWLGSLQNRSSKKL